MEPPSFATNSPHVVRAAPGSDASIVLPLPSGSPPFQYEWSRAGAKLDDRFKHADDAGGVRLTISAARTGDSGVYTLQASNAAGKDSTRVQLEVSPDEKPTGDDPPTFLRRLQDLTVKVGTRTRFLVEIVSSTECRVTWYRNERRLLEAERIALVRDGNFWCADISAVSVDDTGRWTCTAENVGGRASCSAHLNVLVPKAYKRPEFIEELRALLTEQGTVSLECKVVGVPTPVLRWFKDSREIKAGDVFALTANAEDPTSLGTYTCEAVNCMGRAYSSSKVHVIGRASREGSARPTSGGVALEPPPIFTKELEDQFVRICEPLTLSCHIVVPPWPRSIVWYNKEGKIEPSDKYRVLEDGIGGYLLEIPSTEWQDEGEWKCVATSSGGRIGITTSYVSMDVPKNYRKPRFMENLQAVLTEEGLVSFECKVVGFPTPVLSWFKDGQELKPGDVYQLTGTNSLGSYCCIARNCMGQASSSAELTVEDIQNQLNEEEKLQLFSKNQAPKFLQGLKSVEAKIDEPFRFTIKVAIPPEPTVLWYRDDQPVDESSRCHHGKEERGVFFLDIQSLEFMDQAEWKCVAMNDFGHSVTSCFLKLIIPRHYKKPRFLENLQAILSDEGAVNLECKVIGVPQPILKWYKDGEELKPGDIHRIISGQDGTCCLGTYTCEAQNCMGIAASSASLLGFEDSLKSKSKKNVDEQTLQRNLSLSTIHEERTSQMYDTPVGDITLDDKGEISFSFDGKEVSVSLYETPDLTEEEALQIVEMYADQLSENVTEHNVVELPPLRFVKETSTSGNLLMEAIIIDVSPEYFTSPEEDLRTEADIEDISIADENGPPQLSLDQEIDSEDYLEKTIALLSDEKASFPKKMDRKKSDSQKSADDYFSLSRDQSLSEEKKDDDTQVLSESDLQSFASARSLEKPKSKSSKPSIDDGQESSDITKTVLLREDLQTMHKPSESDTCMKNKRERRSRSSRRSSSGSEKSLGKMKHQVVEDNLQNTAIQATVLDQENIKEAINRIRFSLTQVINDVQMIERDIILKSELMSTAATASRSLEIINSLITPLSEIHSIAEAIKEAVNDSLEATTSLFNRLPQSLDVLFQSLIIIEKCIDVESENKTLVKKTCTNIIEKCGDELNKLVIEINSIVNKSSPFLENVCISSIQITTNELCNTIACSNGATKESKKIADKLETNVDNVTPELKHLQKTQKAVYELRKPLKTLLSIAEEVDISSFISVEHTTNSQVILNDMSTPIQELQNALEQIEFLSVTETQSNLQKYNTEIIENVMDSIIKLRTSFEQLSVEAGTLGKLDELNEALECIKHNINDISAHLDIVEGEIGQFNILHSENKLEALQKMAQILINLENNLVVLDTVPYLKSPMTDFHKNLTKLLEHVIESNEAKKYFTFLEICDAVNRLNTLIKNIDSKDMLSLSGISNNLKTIQATIEQNEFTPELNISVLSSTTGLLVNIQEAVNHADISSYSTNSENVEDLSVSHFEEGKLNIVLEQIEKAVTTISNVVSFETAKDLDIKHALNKIIPTLGEIKLYVASSNVNITEKEDNTSDMSNFNLTQAIANRLSELNVGIGILTQIICENVTDIWEQNHLKLELATPLVELCNALEVLQQDVISQNGENFNNSNINATVANAVQSIQSCIIMIQEQDLLENAEELSTLDDISAIKTSADLLSIDYISPNIQEITTEIDTQVIQSPSVENLKIINDYILRLQNPESMKTLDVLSKHGESFSVKSVTVGLSTIQCAIESILHPNSQEELQNLSNFVQSHQMSYLIEPLQELYQSISVIDTSMPLESASQMEKIKLLSQNVTKFENCIDCLHIANDTTDTTLEISTKINALQKLCKLLKQELDTIKNDTLVQSSDLFILDDSVNTVLNALTCTQDINITQVKLSLKKLQQSVINAQNKTLGFAIDNPLELHDEIRVLKSIDDIEKTISSLTEFGLVDIDQGLNIDKCVSPQIGINVNYEKIKKVENKVEIIANFDQNLSQVMSSNTLISTKEFVETFNDEMTLLCSSFKQRLTPKRIIKMLQVFYDLNQNLKQFLLNQQHYFTSEELKEWIVNSEECLKDVQSLLFEVLDTQSHFIIDIPITNIKNYVSVLNKISDSHDNVNLIDLVKLLVNTIKSIEPWFVNIQTDVFEELEFCNVNSKDKDDDIDNFFNTLHRCLLEKIDSKDFTSELDIKAIVKVIENNADCKRVRGMAKKLIFIKCISDCLNIFKQSFIEKENELVKSDENELVKLLEELSKPIECLNEKVLNIVNQDLHCIENSGLVKEFYCVASEFAAIDNISKKAANYLKCINIPLDDYKTISLTKDVINKINLIQKNISNLRSAYESAGIIIDIQPINEIYHKLVMLLPTEVRDEENKLKEKTESLLQHMEHYIEIIEIVEEISAVITLDDFKKSADIARELRECITSESFDDIDLPSPEHYNKAEQIQLVQNLQKALEKLQTETLDCEQQLVLPINEHMRQQITEVVSDIQNDLVALTSTYVVLENPDTLTHDQIDDSGFILVHEQKGTIESLNGNVQIEEAQPSGDVYSDGMKMYDDSKQSTIDYNIKEEVDSTSDIEFKGATTKDDSVPKINSIKELLTQHVNAYLSQDFISDCEMLLPAENFHHLERSLRIAAEVRDNVVLEDVGPLSQDELIKKQSELALQLLEAMVVTHDQYLYDTGCQTVQPDSEKDSLQFAKNVVHNLLESLKVYVTVSLNNVIEAKDEFGDSEVIAEKNCKKPQSDFISVETNTPENISIIADPTVDTLNEEQKLQDESDIQNIVEEERTDNVFKVSNQDRTGINFEQYPQDMDELKKDSTTDQNKLSAIHELETLLQEVNENLSIKYCFDQNSEELQDTLEEVQAVIMKLKCDFDGSTNDILNENIEDLECNVRSVQLQINENSPPELLKEACANLQTLVVGVNNMYNSQSNSSVLTANNVIDVCLNSAEQAVELLDKITNLKDDITLDNIVLNLNEIKDTIRSLKSCFSDGAESLISRGIEIQQNLSHVEDKVFILEKDLEANITIDIISRDSIITAIHAIYGSISNMRGTICSIQKKYMYDNYGQPSDNFLKSIKNVNLIQSYDEKKVWKQFAKSLRKVLKHFEDVKFYINFDKTARLPNDSAFTKIILGDLCTVLSEIISQNINDQDKNFSDQLENAVRYVNEILYSMENKTTVEVKEKIPIFKELSVQMFDLTDYFKMLLLKNIGISNQALLSDNKENMAVITTDNIKDENANGDEILKSTIDICFKDSQNMFTNSLAGEVCKETLNDENESIQINLDEKKDSDSKVNKKNEIISSELYEEKQQTVVKHSENDTENFDYEKVQRNVEDENKLENNNDFIVEAGSNINDDIGTLELIHTKTAFEMGISVTENSNKEDVTEKEPFHIDEKDIFKEQVNNDITKQNVIETEESEINQGENSDNKVEECHEGILNNETEEYTPITETAIDKHDIFNKQCNQETTYVEMAEQIVIDRPEEEFTFFEMAIEDIEAESARRKEVKEDKTYGTVEIPLAVLTADSKNENNNAAMQQTAEVVISREPLQHTNQQNVHVTENVQPNELINENNKLAMEQSDQNNRQKDVQEDIKASEFVSESNKLALQQDDEDVVSPKLQDIDINDEKAKTKIENKSNKEASQQPVTDVVTQKQQSVDTKEDDVLANKNDQFSIEITNKDIVSQESLKNTEQQDLDVKDDVKLIEFVSVNNKSGSKKNNEEILSQEALQYMKQQDDGVEEDIIATVSVNENNIKVLQHSIEDIVSQEPLQNKKLQSVHVKDDVINTELVNEIDKSALNNNNEDILSQGPIQYTKQKDINENDVATKTVNENNKEALQLIIQDIAVPKQLPQTRQEDIGIKEDVITIELVNKNNNLSMEKRNEDIVSREPLQYTKQQEVDVKKDVTATSITNENNKKSLQQPIKDIVLQEITEHTKQQEKDVNKADVDTELINKVNLLAMEQNSEDILSEEPLQYIKQQDINIQAQAAATNIVIDNIKETLQQPIEDTLSQELLRHSKREDDDVKKDVGDIELVDNIDKSTMKQNDPTNEDIMSREPLKSTKQNLTVSKDDCSTELVKEINESVTEQNDKDILTQDLLQYTKDKDIDIKEDIKSTNTVNKINNETLQPPIAEIVSQEPLQYTKQQKSDDKVDVGEIDLVDKFDKSVLDQNEQSNEDIVALETLQHTEQQDVNVKENIKVSEVLSECHKSAMQQIKEDSAAPKTAYKINDEAVLPFQDIVPLCSFEPSKEYDAKEDMSGTEMNKLVIGQSKQTSKIVSQEPLQHTQQQNVDVIEDAGTMGLINVSIISAMEQTNEDIVSLNQPVQGTICQDVGDEENVKLNENSTGTLQLQYAKQHVDVKEDIKVTVLVDESYKSSMQKDTEDIAGSKTVNVNNDKANQQPLEDIIPHDSLQPTKEQDVDIQEDVKATTTVNESNEEALRGVEQNVDVTEHVAATEVENDKQALQKIIQDIVPRELSQHTKQQDFHDNKDVCTTELVKDNNNSAMEQNNEDFVSQEPLQYTKHQDVGDVKATTTINENNKELLQLQHIKQQDVDMNKNVASTEVENNKQALKQIIEDTVPQELPQYTKQQGTDVNKDVCATELVNENINSVKEQNNEALVSQEPLQCTKHQNVVDIKTTPTINENNEEELQLQHAKLQDNDVKEHVTANDIVNENYKLQTILDNVPQELSHQNVGFKEDTKAAETVSENNNSIVKSIKDEDKLQDGYDVINTFISQELQETVTGKVEKLQYDAEPSEKQQREVNENKEIGLQNEKIENKCKVKNTELETLTKSNIHKDKKPEAYAESSSTMFEIEQSKDINVVVDSQTMKDKIEDPEHKNTFNLNAQNEELNVGVDNNSLNTNVKEQNEQTISSIQDIIEKNEKEQITKTKIVADTKCIEKNDKTKIKKVNNKDKHDLIKQEETRIPTEENIILEEKKETECVDQKTSAQEVLPLIQTDDVICEIKQGGETILDTNKENNIATKQQEIKKKKKKNEKVDLLFKQDGEKLEKYQNQRELEKDINTTESIADNHKKEINEQKENIEFQKTFTIFTELPEKKRQSKDYDFYDRDSCSNDLKEKIAEEISNVNNQESNLLSNTSLLENKLNKLGDVELENRHSFIDHSEPCYDLEFSKPSGYTPKSFDMNESLTEFKTSSKSPTIYKAQTLVHEAHLKSSLPPYDQQSNISEGRTDIKQRSKTASESRSTITEKRFPRDFKRKPVFSTHLTDRTAVESSRVKLTCSILSSTEPIISWYKNGILLDNKQKCRSKHVDGLITLEILNAVPSDSGEYSCTVQNENGSITSSANLKVYPGFEASPIPPTFTRSIRDVYHLHENELMLECRIRGQPLPTITWLKDNRPVVLNERYQAHYLADGVCRLTIISPTDEDSGKYTCKAENSMWSDQIMHHVQFIKKENRHKKNIARTENISMNRQTTEIRRPHFTNVLSDHKVVSGGTIGLQVEISGSPTRVEWLREGRSVTESYRNAKTYVDHDLYTLALSDVTEKESGLYTCRAWSTHGNVDMNASITVVQPNQFEGKPATIISRPVKDLLISVGEDLNITFRMQGEPKPKVFLMKGIRDITNSQRVCKMTSDDYVKFTLKRSVVSDAGTYCVFVRNAYGCDRAFVTVVIRQRASSDNLISDWTYPMDDLAVSVVDRNYKTVPDRIPGEPNIVDGGSNWVSLAWPKPDSQVKAPILAYKVESWLLGKEGGARWTELGVTPRNSFDAFNLKQGEEYHFRVTPRNRYGWGEPVQTSTPVGIGLAGDRPDFVDILPGQLKVLVGETATLYCSFKGNPTPEIVWMKNGHEVEEGVDRITIELSGNNTSLRITDINIDDEGRYSCEATNIHGRSSTYSRLAVITDRQIWAADAKLKRERSAGAKGEYPPQFTMRLRDRRVQATYPVRLTCQVIGSPAPIVTWFKNGEEITVDSRQSTSQDEYFHTLEIAPTTLEDGGVYEAMARNGCGAISCRCNLVVDKGIRAYIAPEFCCGFEPLYSVCEGDELRISAVVEAYPSVGVTWYRDGVRLRPSRRAIMTLDRDGQIELAVASVAARDAGVYTCTASNEVGKASTSGKVEVLKGEHTSETPKVPPIVISPDVPYSKEPMFIRKPRSSEAREGDTVLLECEVIGDPKPDVYWLRDFLKPDYYRDASHFKRVGAGPAYRFEIPHAKLDYTGAYSIVAKNIHGEAKAIISLQILAKDPTCSTDSHNIRYGRVDEIPRFEKELTDLLCYDGDAIEFECRVTGNPEPDIRWFHYTEVLPECSDFETSFVLGTARLKIQRVTAEDEGTYTCEASNNMGKATSSACLVIYPPGEPNTLSQRLRRPPALLSASSTPRSTPRTTPARSLSRTPGPDLRRLCSPSREIAPKFYTYPYNKVVEEGDTVVFQCAVRGLPPPWATWDKDGIIVTPTARISIREKDDMFRILEIEEVTIEDVGLYRVTLENDYGRAEASARLEVISQTGKFHGSRSYSVSPRKCLTYRRRTPSLTRQD